MHSAHDFYEAAALIAGADSLIVTAGAGMGVDSGLPDFRGPEGFWGAYPALGQIGLHFQDIASPDAFVAYPELAWGFYGHRLRLYRETPPGPAFAILKAIAAQLRHGAFVITSNVDGHFQKAGFSPMQIWEAHGSIHHLQCMKGCMSGIWPAKDFDPEVDLAACRLINAPPSCPWCGELARPNILMFGDWGWLEHRSGEQEARFNEWRRKVGRPVVIEIGAGTAIPTVRRISESFDALLIRVNPSEHTKGSVGGVSLATSATKALREIADALEVHGFRFDHS